MVTFLSGSTHTLSIPVVIKPKSLEKELKVSIKDAQGKEIVCVPWTKKKRGVRGKTVYVFKVKMPLDSGEYSVGLLPADIILPSIWIGPMEVDGEFHEVKS